MVIKVFVVSVFALASTFSVAGAPICVSGTLTSFAPQTAAGCMIGNTTINNLAFATRPTDRPIAADSVIVTPTATGLEFLFLNATAAGNLETLLIGFEVRAPNISLASLSITGTSLEVAAASVFENICSGAGFDTSVKGLLGTPSNGCTQNGGTLLDMFTLYTSISNAGARTTAKTALPNVTVIGVIDDISVSGILGRATLNTLNNDFSTGPTAVPEPSTASLLLLGSLALGLAAAGQKAFAARSSRAT